MHADHNHHHHGHESTFITRLKQNAQSVAGKKSKDASPVSVGGCSKGSDDDHDGHSHEDYFQRQQNAIAHVHVTPKMLYEARKLEWMKEK